MLKGRTYTNSYSTVLLRMYRMRTRERVVRYSHISGEKCRSGGDSLLKATHRLELPELFLVLCRRSGAVQRYSL